MIRCGGWVDHGDGKGWVLYVPGLATGTRPAPAVVTGQLTETEREADRQAAESREQAQPESNSDMPPVGSTNDWPDRAACPDCGKEVAVNKNGTLRKHTCLIDAPAPEVTFEDEGGE
jgi:hypothetical protein